MKLWRGQPDHDHWKVPFSSRDKAKASFGMAAVCASVALASAFAAKAGCESGGRSICGIVRGLASALGMVVHAVEVTVWAGIAVLLVLLGLIQWRNV